MCIVPGAIVERLERAQRAERRAINNQLRYVYQFTRHGSVDALFIYLPDETRPGAAAFAK